MPIKGLFINNEKAQDSIYESGLMVFRCLQLSGKYQLDYIEISQQRHSLPGVYDFYFFNYHPATMQWMDTGKLKKKSGLIMTMILEVSPGNPFVMCPPQHFHGYCVLDPTIVPDNKRVFTFPRPLEHANVVSAPAENASPVIGTFGFATKGKGFQHVVEAVNKEFETATIKINIPYGDFVPESKLYAGFLGDLCKKKAKNGIEVIVTHDYMSKEALINWCAQNTLNCFLYDRNLPGLAATTDQAIVAGRPIAVSNNDTFRHLLAYLKPYPQWSLRKSIDESLPQVVKMKEEWSPENFAKKFEDMLQVLMAAHPNLLTEKRPFLIPVIKNDSRRKLINFYKKYKGVFSIRKVKQLSIIKRIFKHEELI